MRQTLPDMPGVKKTLYRAPLRGWEIPVAMLVAGIILLASTALATVGRSRDEDTSANHAGVLHLYGTLTEMGCQLETPPFYQRVALDYGATPLRMIAPFGPEYMQHQSQYQVAL